MAAVAAEDAIKTLELYPKPICSLLRFEQAEKEDEKGETRGVVKWD